METNFDLFGNPIEEKTSLRDNFVEPPFTVLDARGGGMARKEKQVAYTWYPFGSRSRCGGNPHRHILQ